VPWVPSKGSVGASGDLAPLAHMTLALMGEGFMLVDGAPVPALGALQAAGIAPLVLGPKEGLALYRAFIDHTVEHFAQEERWMLATGFTADNCHAEEHATILETMQAVVQRSEQGDTELITRMAEALAEWFPLHAASKDAGLAQHLKNVGFDSGTETVPTLANHFAPDGEAVTHLDSSFNGQVQQLREAFPPQDDTGLGGPDTADRRSAWQRADTFDDPQ